MASPNPLDSRFRGNDGVRIGSNSAIIASLRLRAFALNFLCQHALASSERNRLTLGFIAVGIHSSARHEGAEDGEDGVAGSGKAVGSHIVVDAPVGTAGGVSVGGAGAPVGTTAIGSDAGAAVGWASSQATDAMAERRRDDCERWFQGGFRRPLSVAKSLFESRQNLRSPSRSAQRLQFDRAKLSIAACDKLSLHRNGWSQHDHSPKPSLDLSRQRGRGQARPASADPRLFVRNGAGRACGRRPPARSRSTRSPEPEPRAWRRRGAG